MKGLADAILRLKIQETRSTSDDDDLEPIEVQAPVDKFPHVIHRKNGVVGGNMSAGPVELIADYLIFSLFFDKANYTVGASAILPDERILFSFEWKVVL